MRSVSCAAAAALLVASLVACAGFPMRRSAEPEAEAIVFDAADSNTTRTYLALAAMREDSADWTGALARVDKALAHQPRSRGALLRRAELLALATPDSDLDEVREILAAAEDEDAEALAARGLLAAAEGDGDAAAENARRAGDAGADATRVYWIAARLLTLHGDANAALPLAERAVELDAKSGAARRERARARLRSGDFDGTRDDLELQIRVHPEDAESRGIQADLLRRVGADDFARDALEAIAASRRDAGAQALLGRIALEQGELDAARATLDPAAAAHPTHAGVQAALCALDARERRADACVQRLDAAVAAAPEDVALVRIRARALGETRRNDEAATAFARAVALDPDATETLQAIVAWIGAAADGEARIAALGLAPAPTQIAIGMLRETRGDRAGAVASHEKALAANPASPLARASLARALAAQGQSLDRAVSLAREARAARPNDPDFAWALGLAHLRRGQEKSAIESLGGAAGTYPVERPGFPELIWNAAQALDRAGDRSAAAHTADMALALAKHHGPQTAPWMASARALNAKPAAAKTASATTPAATDAATPAVATTNAAEASEAAPTPATTTPATAPTPPPAANAP
jgi:tetratricopeptide (TPR) repeat protein